MPTLRTIPGELVTLSFEGARVLRSQPSDLRDAELGNTDTRDIYLAHPPLSPTLLAVVSGRYAAPLMEALHAALDAAEAGVIVDVAGVLAEVMAKP